MDRDLGPWAHTALSNCEDSLTFRGRELNVILLAEGGWEDGVGGGMVTEPVRAICGGPPIHADHQVAVEENLVRGRAGRHHGITNGTPHPRGKRLRGDTRGMEPTRVRAQPSLSFCFRRNP